MNPTFRARTENANKCEGKLVNIAFELEDITRLAFDERTKNLTGIALSLVKESIEEIKKEEGQ